MQRYKVHCEHKAGLKKQTLTTLWLCHKVIAREEDVSFSDGVRAAACRALEPADGGIAVVDDPTADPRQSTPSDFTGL